MLFACIIITACETNQRFDLAPTVISTVAPAPTQSPTLTPILTATVCPPSPPGQEFPLPKDIKGFISRYYRTPGRVIDGMEFYMYMPIGFEVYADANGEWKTRDKGFNVGDASMGDRHMLWLEKNICTIEGTESSPQSYTYYQVVDVVELPPRENGFLINLNTCTNKDSPSKTIVGFGKVTTENRAPSEPLYAWEINIEAMKIVPIDTQNIKCYFNFPS